MFVTWGLVGPREAASASLRSATMTKPRGRQQWNKGLVDMRASAPEVEKWQPDHDACTYDEYNVDLLGTEDRVFVRMWHDEHMRLVDFRLIQLAAAGDDGEEWAEVVKVDCHLNRVHIH